MRAVLIESEGAEARLLDDADESLLSGDVELDVLYSSYNYKDGMAIAGQGIARAHPLIPGIDLVGRVTASAEEQFSAGDLVVLNGDGIGESRHGGFATRARVRADALVRLPADLSPQRAAAIGPAGFTAMPAVLRSEERRGGEEHTSELQSRGHLVCRLLLEKKKNNNVMRADEDRRGEQGSGQ